MSAPTLPAAAPDSARTGTRLGAIALLGLGGAVSLAWGAWRVGAVTDRRGRLTWLQGVPILGAVPLPSRPLAYVLWGLGLAGLSGAWLLLRRRTVVSGHGVAVSTVAAIAALWMLPLLAAPPMGSRDVYSYVAHGELAAEGLDPGEVAPVDLGLTSPLLQSVDPIWRRVVSAYGPLNTGVSEAAVRATGDGIEGTVILWRLVAIGGVALLGAGVVALARSARRDPVDALVLAVGGPLTVVQLVGAPHNEALMIGLMAVGLALGTSRTGRWAWVGGVSLCALGAAVKAPALLGAGYLGWTAPGPDARLAARVGRTVVAGILSLAVLEATSLVAGVGWGWLGGLSAGSNVTSLLSLSTTLGLVGAWVLQQPVGLGTVVTGVRNVFLAASAAVAGVLLWRTPKLALAGLAGALLVLAVMGPAVHPWYVAWCLPPAAVVLAGRRVPWAMAFAVVAAASTRPMGGGIVKNLGYFSLPTLLAMIVVALVAWRWWHQPPISSA
jgi:alpha-1,6-mannosyltransferase